MTNLLTYLIGRYGVLCVTPSDSKKGIGILGYLVMVAGQVARKYYSDQQLKSKDDIIRQKELEISRQNDELSDYQERVKVLEEKEKIYQENNSYLNDNINTSTAQDLRIQNNEFKSLIQRHEELQQERNRIIDDEQALEVEGENLRTSLDNNEQVREEIIQSYRKRVDKTINDGESNIDRSNNTMVSIKDWIENYRNNVGAAL